ncbi:MAG: hypothetical protein K5888_09580 [Lachnospiraceae bacterium]|nr:hypothetical protein [Lachnospiraceae bacterium]
MKEIEDFLKSVEDTDTELKIFSPFDTDEIFNGRIEHEKAELEKLKEDCKVQEDLIADLEIRIAQFKEMLEEQPEESPVKKEKDDPEPVQEKNHFLLVYDIQEKERFRLSSDLHDNTVQNLVHVCHGLELASMFIDQDPVRAKLEIASCIKNIKSSIDEIRDIIFDLRPMELDDLGFKACFENFIANMKVSYSDVIFETDVDELDKDNTLLLNVFMVIKEIVVNSLKHSKSPKIKIIVKQNNQTIDIMIKDFGVGFDPRNVSDNHFGLHLVKDRIELINGKIEVNSSETEGTEVHITV